MMSGFYPRLAKPVIDSVLAVILLVVLSPLLLLIALAVRLTSKGPVFFVQDRIGLNEHVFRMLKFRTMRLAVDSGIGREAADLELSGTLLKKQDDPRVTRVGRVLRLYSLDELPQLLNVLRGDMSLVGPRPLIPFMFSGRPTERRIRCQLRPGLTGRWQVEARDACNSLQDMWAFDVEYLQSVSLKEDLNLIVRTIPIVLTGKGAK
jgi:lipopolysaccharide/colanic/teichoic acid biosynthesis glycosyltransferase